AATMPNPSCGRRVPRRVQGGGSPRPGRDRRTGGLGTSRERESPVAWDRGARVVGGVRSPSRAATEGVNAGTVTGARIHDRSRVGTRASVGQRATWLARVQPFASIR